MTSSTTYAVCVAPHIIASTTTGWRRPGSSLASKNQKKNEKLKQKNELVKIELERKRSVVEMMLNVRRAVQQGGYQKVFDQKSTEPSADH